MLVIRYIPNNINKCLYCNPCELDWLGYRDGNNESLFVKKKKKNYVDKQILLGTYLLNTYT